MKIIFSFVLATMFFASAYAQSTLALKSEQLMPNKVGVFMTYNSDGNGNRDENSIGGGYIATYNAKFGKVPFTIFNVGAVQESSATPVGGRQFSQELEARFPLDLQLPFGGDTSTVYVHAGSRFLWQNGGDSLRSKFTVVPGFGAGFKVNLPFGTTYTSYTYVPRVNTANSLQEHRVGVEIYRTLADNPKFGFYTRTTAGTGRFNVLPVAINFSSNQYYNVIISVGMTRNY